MMKRSCGKTTLKLMHNSAASEVWTSVCRTFIRMTSVVFMNLCFFQVGDHHSDFYVWDLHNNHEVNPFFVLCKFPPSWYQATTCLNPLETQYVCVFCLLCRFNQSLYSLVEKHCSRAGQPCLSSLRRSTAVGSVGECDNDMVPLKPGAGAHVCTSVCV